jgi:tyrosine-protein kinase Etk/Wzc
MTPNMQPPVHQTQNLQEVHLVDYIRVLLRRRRTFAIAFGVVFLGVLFYTFLKTPVYEASATLNIKDENKKGGALGELALLTSNNPIDAEIEIIRSRTIAEDVVKRLHLDWQILPVKGKAVCRLAEFSSAETKPVYALEITGPAGFTLYGDNGSLIGQGVIGQLFKAGGVSLLVTELRGVTGDRCNLVLKNFNSTVASLKLNIKVSEVGKKTNIVRIAYASSNPVLAREVVNTLVQAYLDQTITFKTLETSRTVAFVEEQLKGVRQDLEKSEGDLQVYKAASGVIKLDTEAEELIRKVSDSEKERAAVSLQKKQIEFALSSLKEASLKGVTYSPAALGDDGPVVGMSTRLADLEVQKQALLPEYTRDHPQVRAIQGQIDELQRKIRATYETSRNNLTKREGDIAKRLGDYEAKLKKLPTAERELARFLRVTTVNAGIYTFLLQKHEEARIAQAATISNIKIVDPAITPDRPIKPQKKKNVILGLLVSLMVAVGLAFFHDYMDDTIKDGEEAKRLLGWPLLGIIPFIQTELDEGERSDANLISKQKPKSAAAEAFRGLRTSLHFSSTRKQRKVILVTSSFPGEGKTTISANLAEIFSQTGARVLLIGCDLRRPTLHQIFGFAKTPGLTELLTGDCQRSEVIHQTGSGTLDFISAGTIPPNPAELLGSEEMAALLTELRAEYDYIILDAPPTLAVSDTPILAACSDALVVLMEVGRVSAKVAARLRDILNAVEVPIAGIVINDKAGKGESYGYYGYDYGYYYGDDDDNKPDRKPLWRRLLRR